jgi:hypothetical protein
MNNAEFMALSAQVMQEAAKRSQLEDQDKPSRSRWSKG